MSTPLWSPCHIEQSIYITSSYRATLKYARRDNRCHLHWRVENLNGIIHMEEVTHITEAEIYCESHGDMEYLFQIQRCPISSARVYMTPPIEIHMCIICEHIWNVIVLNEYFLNPDWWLKRTMRIWIRLMLNVFISNSHIDCDLFEHIIHITPLCTYTYTLSCIVYVSCKIIFF